MKTSYKILVTKMIALLCISVFIFNIPALSFQLGVNDITTAKVQPTTAKVQPSNTVQPIKQPLPKISSEEETIDSFDVNPKSGRWSTTDTNQVLMLTILNLGLVLLSILLI